MEETKKSSKMAIVPIQKLFITMGTPIVLSMMLQAAYNIIDSAFLSNMKENGEAVLTALSLAFPIQLLMVAIGVGTGVGVNGLLARSLGQGDKEKASKTVGNGLTLVLIYTVVFVLFGFLGVRPYIASQSGNGTVSAAVVDMAVDYLQICCWFSLGQCTFSVLEKMLQATGRSLYSTIAQIAGAATNILLDPILIYGWLGLPECGVKGAAYATVIGQFVSGIVAFIFHMKFNHEIDKSPKYMKISGTTLKSIYAVGFPAIIAQAVMTVMTYGMNIILGKILEVGENAITVYGLYCKVQQLVTFAAFGLRDAITPIVSFNHGMHSKQRVKDGIRYGLVYMAILMIFGTILIESIAIPLTKLFSLSDQSYGLCLSCMRIISLSFLFAGLNVAFQRVFQALERGMESLVVSLCRQIIFILPVAWALVQLINGASNASLVWWTFLIGEGATLVISILMFIPTYRKKVNAMES